MPKPKKPKTILYTRNITPAEYNALKKYGCVAFERRRNNKVVPASIPVGERIMVFANNLPGNTPFEATVVVISKIPSPTLKDVDLIVVREETGKK